MKKCLVIKNKCLPLYRVKEITRRPGPVPRTKITTVMATLKYTTREINGKELKYLPVDVRDWFK